LRDLSSDLRLRFALQRRGLALDMANLCAYETHELLIQIYMDCLLVTPPPGYSRPSYTQIKRAVEMLWRRIAQVCRKGVRITAGQTPPFQEALARLIYDPEFRLYLMPLPSSSSSSSSGGGGNASSQDSKDAAERISKRKLRALQWENEDLRNKMKYSKTDDTPKGRGKKGANKGKGRGKGEGRGPAELEGKLKALPNGDPICFNFTLRHCPFAKAGQRCGRG